MYCICERLLSVYINLWNRIFSFCMTWRNTSVRVAWNIINQTLSWYFTLIFRQCSLEWVFIITAASLTFRIYSSVFFFFFFSRYFPHSFILFRFNFILNPNQTIWVSSWLRIMLTKMRIWFQFSANSIAWHSWHRKSRISFSLFFDIIWHLMSSHEL